MASEESATVDDTKQHCIVLRCMVVQSSEETHEVPKQSLAERLRKVSSLFNEGEIQRAEEMARVSLDTIPKNARGTRMMAYAVLLQSPEFTIGEHREEVLTEASAMLQEATEKSEEHLAAAWLLTAFGGELAPEERDRVLKIAEGFRTQRKSNKKKTMAMTIVAAHCSYCSN